MNQERWRQVRDLFELALERPASEVAAWLERETGDDSALRAEVASLLEHHARAGTFLMEPPVPDFLAGDTPLEPGQIVGPYTIVREAGRGGMGRVYVATDRRLGRTVALKAVRTLVTDSAERERIRLEARAAAALTHPGICTIFALEEVDGDLYIASELIEGRTLRQEMADGRKPDASESMETALAIAAALAAAHQTGVTHGDLKPENIMRTYDGRLKILDFGLARMELAPLAGADTDGDARPEWVAGTPGYMSPELLNGRPREPRSDLFAFGVVMYEYTCGVHPFDGSNQRVLESDPQPIEEMRPDLAPALAAAIERCLRKSAADRFASASEIVKALSLHDRKQAQGSVAAWWRAHQAIVIALYFVASLAAWHAKESRGFGTATVFLIVGTAATLVGVLRGHLLFTAWVNEKRLTQERRRAASITMALDLLIALALGFDGAVLASSTPLAGVLTIALGVGLGVARLVLEPSTTAAAFEPT